MAGTAEARHSRSPCRRQPTPHTVEALLRVVEQRDCGGGLLKLMVDKLKLQLLRRVGPSSAAPASSWDDPQKALIEGAHCMNRRRPKAEPKAQAANAGAHRSQLPAHLPRENQCTAPPLRTHDTTSAASPAAARACGGRLRRSARTSPSNWSTCRRASRSCAMCARSWPACPARRSSRPPHPAGRSRAAWPGRRCWPTCWSPSTVTTSRCTAWRHLRAATA
jgi:hypothetical protein